MDAKFDPKQQQILTEHEHLPILNNALDLIQHAQRHIDQARRAGLSTEGFQKILDEHRVKALNLKNSYFPGK